MPRFKEPALVYHPAPFPSLVLPRSRPFTGATTIPAQELVLSFPSPALLGALAEHFFDAPNTVRAIPLSHIPHSFLARVTQPPKEAPVSPSSRPRYSTGPPSACRASRITNHDGETVPGQSQWPGSFALVLPPSITAVNGGASMQMLGGPILLDLTRGSQRRKLTLSVHLNSSKSNPS